LEFRHIISGYFKKKKRHCSLLFKEILGSSVLPFVAQFPQAKTKICGAMKNTSNQENVGTV
jgi:hypothetical protein